MFNIKDGLSTNYTYMTKDDMFKRANDRVYSIIKSKENYF